MDFVQKFHTFFSIKNLKISRMFFRVEKTKFIRKIIYSLPLTALFLWLPKIAYAETGGVVSDWLGFLNPIEWIKKLFEWVLGMGLAFLAAIIAFIAMIINLIITALTWLASFFAEFALNFTLTTEYTSGNVFNAGWPVFRDIANMGLVLVLVAIALGTMLKLKIGNKNQLVPFLLIAFLINFTPLIVGLVIDISNIISLIFWDSAKNFVSAFMAANPLGDTTANIAIVGTFIKDAVLGNFGLDQFAAIILTYSLAILISLVILFIFLLLTALFFGRTLALLVLGIVSPVAFLAYILPTTRKYFSSWWDNFLKWALITIPLLVSMWLAGLFVNNLTGLCTKTAGQYFNANIPQKGIAEALSGGNSSQEFSLIGDGGANACAITSLAFAAAILIMGVQMSLKSSAAGASLITSRAKKLKDATTKWAKKETAKRTRQVTAKPLAATGQRLAGTRLAQSRLGAPVRNLGLAMQTPAMKFKEQYKQESKRFANMELEQMYGMFFDRGDKGAAAWAYAAREKPDELRKALDDPETGKELKKAMEAMFKRADFRGDSSMDDVKKIAIKEAAEFKARKETDPVKKEENIENEKSKLVGKLDDKGVANLSQSSLQDNGIVKALEEQGKLTRGAIVSLAKEETRLAELDGVLQENYKKELVEELKKMKSEERLKIFGPTSTRGDLLDAKNYKIWRNYKRTNKMDSEYMRVIKTMPYAAALHSTTRTSREGLTKKDIESLEKKIASSEDKK